MDITIGNVQVLFMDLTQQGLIIMAPIFLLSSAYRFYCELRTNWFYVYR